MRAGLNTFQPESTRIKASPKRENPIKTKDQYRLRNFFRPSMQSDPSQHCQDPICTTNTMPTQSALSQHCPQPASIVSTLSAMSLPYRQNTLPALSDPSCYYFSLPALSDPYKYSEPCTVTAQALPELPCDSMTKCDKASLHW